MPTIPKIAIVDGPPEDNPRSLDNCLSFRDFIENMAYLGSVKGATENDADKTERIFSAEEVIARVLFFFNHNNGGPYTKFDALIKSGMSKEAIFALGINSGNGSSRRRFRIPEIVDRQTLFREFLHLEDLRIQGKIQLDESIFPIELRYRVCELASHDFSDIYGTAEGCTREGLVLRSSRSFGEFIKNIAQLGKLSRKTPGFWHLEHEDEVHLWQGESVEPERLIAAVIFYSNYNDGPKFQFVEAEGQICYKVGRSVVKFPANIEGKKVAKEYERFNKMKKSRKGDFSSGLMPNAHGIRERVMRLADRYGMARGEERFLRKHPEEAAESMLYEEYTVGMDAYLRKKDPFGLRQRKNGEPPY